MAGVQPIIDEGPPPVDEAVECQQREEEHIKERQAQAGQPPGGAANLRQGDGAKDRCAERCGQAERQERDHQQDLPPGGAVGLSFRRKHCHLASGVGHHRWLADRHMLDVCVKHCQERYEEQRRPRRPDDRLAREPRRHGRSPGNAGGFSSRATRGRASHRWPRRNAGCHWRLARQCC